MTLFPDLVNQEEWVNFNGTMGLKRTHTPVLGLTRIAQFVCRAFGVTLSQLQGPQRNQHVARPRQVVCWLAYGTGDYTASQIGRFLRRDHSTVLHGVRQVWNLRNYYPEFKATTGRLWHLIVEVGEERKGGL